MEVKTAVYLFTKQFIFFFFLGLLLFSFYDYFPELIKKEIEIIFFENLAMKMIIFFILITASGMFLLFLGPLKDNEKRKALVYKYFVLPPATSGISLCGVSFGLIFSLGIVALIEHNNKLAIQMFAASFYIALFASFYLFLALMVKDDILKPVTNKHARFGGLILMISAPLLTYLTYSLTISSSGHFIRRLYCALRYAPFLHNTNGS